MKTMKTEKEKRQEEWRKKCKSLAEIISTGQGEIIDSEGGPVRLVAFDGLHLKFVERDGVPEMLAKRLKQMAGRHALGHTPWLKRL